MGWKQSDEDRALAAMRRRAASAVPVGEFDHDETTGVRTSRGLAGVEATVKRLKWWISAVAIPAIAAIVLAAKFLISYARESERAAILREIDHDRIVDHSKQLDEILNRLREVESITRKNEARLDRRRDAAQDIPAPSPKVTP